MATSYGTNIRSSLNKNGIQNNRIGFKDGYVTVDGKNFVQVGQNNKGVSYSTNAAFNTALKNLGGSPIGSAATSTVAKIRPSVVPSQSGKTTQSTTATQPVPTYQPPVSQTQQTLTRIADQLAKNQQTQFKAPEAFNYTDTDLESDPQYQSQLALARRNVQRQQFDTNALLRASGQGKSSYSETVSNQVGANAMQDIADTIVPQLVQQRFQQYQDYNNRAFDAQKANYAVGTDALNGLGNLYTYQNQEYFQNPITEAATTGNYQSTEVKNAVNQLLDLKRQAETKGITKEARSALSQQADQIRQYISSQGVDTSTLGAKTASKKIKAGNVGVRTLQAQQVDEQARQNRVQNAIEVGNQTGRVVTPQMDANGLWRQAASGKAPLTLEAQQQQWQQNYLANRAQTEDQQWNQEFGYKKEQDAVANSQWQQEFEYRAVRDVIGDSQWQAQFDQSVNEFGLEYALNEQIQLGNLTLADAQNAREQGKYDAEMAAAGTVDVNEIAAKYLDPVIKVDPDTGLPVDQEAAERQIASIAGGDANLAAKLYLRYGMKPDFDYSPQ